MTSIGEQAFSGCTWLKSITIPKSVTSIGEQAFGGCWELADENGLVVVRDTVYDCKNVERITIPEGVQSIGDLAFWGCSSLTSVMIPESVTRIGKGVF